MPANTLYDFVIETADHQQIAMETFRGKTLLIVNVASRCGFTPQYAGLEKLYQQYKEKGLVILGFPCNQFGQQEPVTNAEIQTFCQTHYQVTFPVFSKIDVNGKNAHPLYDYLKTQQKGWFGSTAIKWNFTKFLVDKNGNVIRRYAPFVTPEKIGAELIINSTH